MWEHIKRGELTPVPQYYLVDTPHTVYIAQCFSEGRTRGGEQGETSVLGVRPSPVTGTTLAGIPLRYTVPPVVRNP